MTPSFVISNEARINAEARLLAKENKDETPATGFRLEGIHTADTLSRIAVDDDDLSPRRSFSNESARISSSSYLHDREQFSVDRYYGHSLHEAKSNLTSNRWILAVLYLGCPTLTHEGLNIRPARTTRINF